MIYSYESLWKKIIKDIKENEFESCEDILRFELTDYLESTPTGDMLDVWNELCSEVEEWDKQIYRMRDLLDMDYGWYEIYDMISDNFDIHDPYCGVVNAKVVSYKGVGDGFETPFDIDEMVETIIKNPDLVPYGDIDLIIRILG